MHDDVPGDDDVAPKEIIRLTRGLRQGCPMAVALFAAFYQEVCEQIAAFQTNRCKRIMAVRQPHNP
eukprot:12119357-Prorocentrum_lima.AAC.1